MKPGEGELNTGQEKRACESVYKSLLEFHGKRNWWPGDSRFEIMVGAILTQNTAWRNVEKAIDNLKQANALSPEALMSLHHRRLASLLRPSGYYNVKTKRVRAFCQWLLQNNGADSLEKWQTAKLRKALLSVHGIGPETADDILLYAFNRKVFVVDAYTRRIFSRLGVLTGDETYEDIRAMFEKVLKSSVGLFNEYHALIVIHGATICKSRPDCKNCILSKQCNYNS
ncbi:MAG: endonuclease III domain-containing protein [Acidiferrobacterales bacterium]